jgi:uncharacterized hydrophobic protein (TIGR00271 family)
MLTQMSNRISGKEKNFNGKMKKSASFSIQEEITDARENLLWASRLNWNYILMNCLAATLATYGLFSDSPAVVIGSMIVAMLLSPISSLALGIIDNNLKLIAHSLLTLAAGLSVVFVTSAFLGWIHQSSPLTHEIMTRTAPNFMDLMIALAGGTAGALSLIHKRLATAFVGVAIATALVPPLASSAVLLVRGQYDLSYGAFLLTFTNIVGIQFGYSLVLWLNHVELIPTINFKKNTLFIKRNLVALVLLVGLGILLSRNLIFVIKKFNFENETRIGLSKQINHMKGSYLVEIRFDRENDTLIIRAVMRGPNEPDKNTVAAMEKTISTNYLKIPNELRIRFVKTEIITRDGELFNDFDK